MLSESNIRSIFTATVLTLLAISFSGCGSETTSGTVTSNKEGGASKSWRLKDGVPVNRQNIIENTSIGYKGYSLTPPESIKMLNKTELPPYAVKEVEKQRKSVPGIQRKDMRIFMNEAKDVIIYFIVETHEKVESFRSLDEKKREGFLNAMIGDEVSDGEVIDSGLFNHQERSGLYVDTIGKCADGGNGCFARYIYILGFKNEVFRIHGLSVKNNAENLGQTLNQIIQNLIIR